jgi:hypothetical protein
MLDDATMRELRTAADMQGLSQEFAELEALAEKPPPVGHDSRILHELAGAASLCWEPKPTGVFDSQTAIGFVEQALKELRESAALAEKPALTDEQIEALVEALNVYADPGFYHACAFMFDRPTGGFDEDFSFDEGYGRDMPGKLARETLDAILAAQEKGTQDTE